MKMKNSQSKIDNRRLGDVRGASRYIPKASRQQNLGKHRRHLGQRSFDSYTYRTQHSSTNRGIPFISNRLRQNLANISSFAKLPDNWNYNGAVAITEPVIARTKQVIKLLRYQPDIFPTGRDTIQLEYEKENGDYLEFEIYSNRIESLYIINDQERQRTITNNTQISKLVEAFHAG